MKHIKTDLIAPDRRAFLARSSVTLSAAAVAVLAGTETLAQASNQFQRDNREPCIRMSSLG